MAKDYYKILGIGKDASEDDIKKAYKKAALKVRWVQQKLKRTSGIQIVILTTRNTQKRSLKSWQRRMKSCLTETSGKFTISLVKMG